MKKWKKYEESGNYPSYQLTREANPIWFAKVYPVDGKYTFTIGKRITESDSSPARFNSTKKWKSATTAKVMALEALYRKQFIESENN